jgi:hypothetical protein
MAFEEVLSTITLLSSQDVSSYQYCLVSFSTVAGYAGPSTGPLGLHVGILQDKTTAVNGPMKIGILGVSKLQVGETSASEVAITYGTPLVASSASLGHAIASTATGKHVVAISLGANSTGALGIIPVMLAPFGQLSS